MWIMSEGSWWSTTESPKGWMSVRDADLFEELLHRMAVRARGARLGVVEWGAGRSTVWYTAFLELLKVPYCWLAIEHDGRYFRSEIAHQLGNRSNATILGGSDGVPRSTRTLLDAGGLVVILFDAGELWPSEVGHELDRTVDLDTYVALPAQLQFDYDLAVVDGRKRRRCLLEAARNVKAGGYAVLHDAWRRHYHCAWDGFQSGRRFGDEWWIGSQAITDFSDVLPWHAFERHVNADPIVLP